MNTEFYAETDLEAIPYMLKHMIKESRKWRKTGPHSRRGCEDRSTCLIHAKGTK